MLRGACLSIALTGCTTAPQPAPAPVAPGRPSAAPSASAAPAGAAATALPSTRSRYVPGPAFVDLGDGWVGATVHNRRVRVRGESEHSVIDAEAIDDLGRGHRIPATLGGGWVFVGSHSVRHAATYAGALTSIANEPAATEVTLGVGYRRLMLRFDEDPPRLYSVPEGKPVAIEPKGAVALFGSPKGHVAAIGAKGELWFSAAGGKPWSRLVAPPARDLRYDGKGIIVDTERDTLRLRETGKLEIAKSEPGMTVAWNVDAFQEPWLSPRD